MKVTVCYRTYGHEPRDWGRRRMNNPNTTVNRLIKVSGGIIGPREPRPKTIRIKQTCDYPEVAKAHLAVAEIFADEKLAGGVPICDESVALVQHLFTEEEAMVMRHIKPGLPQTAKMLADAENRPIEEIHRILQSLAVEKHIVLRLGEGDAAIYMVMPIVPGIFEFALARQSMDTLTEWHRRFCQLFENLFETGYVVDHVPKQPPTIKYLTMGQVVRSSPVAFPSDKLEEVFAKHKSFGLTLCQCRIAEKVVGRGCGKPMEVCMTFGPIADMSIKAGRSRRITMKDGLEIKAEAEASGLVTWIDACDPSIGGTSCSCCGDCCHFMRRISEFNVPASLAPPHFIPRVDSEKCNCCGKCALACPMGAVTVDVVNSQYTWNAHRCIGCAQCAAACSKAKAIEMAAVPDCPEFLQNRVGIFF